ncbi:hypothetical protein F4859DRAFT_524337 [Xylaria cf. heliscus]|nr:hypothetical protein F4859DRAFT_524337 [Xylaria cf. heliscus]
MDPFAQQLVQNKRELTAVNDSSATILRAGRYSQDPDIHMLSITAQADFLMQSAVYSGLGESHEKVSQKVSFNCPTGNCTWLPYESLAVCSTCTNITASLNRQVSYADSASLASTTIHHTEFEPGTAFILPNGLCIDNKNGVQLYRPPGSPYNGILMTTFGTGNASRTVGIKSLDTLIWSMTMIRAGPNPKNSSASWPDVPIAATECALFYCINSYQSAVKAGILFQEVTPVQGTRSPRSWQPLRLYVNETGLIGSEDSSIEFSSQFSLFKRSDLALLSNATGHMFNISQSAVDSISFFFQQTFASDEMNLPLDTRPNGTNNTALLNGFYVGSTGSTYQPSLIQILFRSSDLTSSFATLATSMTNALINSADNIETDGIPKEQVGQTQSFVIVYRIEWGWIALHAIVLAAAWLFFIITIRINQRSGQGKEAWKSNSLAVLGRGSMVNHILQEDTQSVGQMEQIAKHTKVCLFHSRPPNSDSEMESNPLHTHISPE